MNTNKTELTMDELDAVNGGNQIADRMLSRGGKGAAMGAGVGAAAGSFFPVVGTVGGALIGTTVGFIGGLASAIFDP